MAAKPSVRFMATKTGKVHVVTTKANDNKTSKCQVVKAGHDKPAKDGGWGSKKGVSPEAAVDMDECIRCGSRAVAKEQIKANKTPAQKRAEAKEKSKETMDKLARGSAKEPSKKAEAKRRGPKQSRPESMKEKCEEHAELAKKHGWHAKVSQTASNEWTCEATRDKETLKLVYQDGRTVWSRVTLASGVEVRLRNSANWRKHAEGKSKIKSDYTPRTSNGKKAAKAQVITDDAPRKLPFSLDDDNDVIIESLVGKHITWRNGLSGTLDSAKVPTRARNVRLTSHPKNNRRLLNFHESQGHHPDHGEMLGGERTVALDKILRVK